MYLAKSCSLINAKIRKRILNKTIKRSDYDDFNAERHAIIFIVHIVALCLCLQLVLRV